MAARRAYKELAVQSDRRATSLDWSPINSVEQPHRSTESSQCKGSKMCWNGEVGVEEVAAARGGVP